ncbi:MAG: hypothetical protein CEE38_21505 [Planctomycetes bacterium B3_Pla]|nr:MAG: hypothetical protein CEE38_21505 [Planctomycetes bacterium B3_Pla]
MLRIDRNQKSLTPMTNQSLSEAGLTERYDLQQLIRQNAEAFFAEMGEKLLLVGEEVCPTDVVDDRIDLLSVDKDAAAVIIEIKRGNDRLQLLQALSYAAMVSKWEPQQLIDGLSILSGVSAEEAQEQIEEFLDTDMSALNQRQRIVLLAEAFDFEVLATAEWLSEQYDLDIRCYQLKLAADSKLEYLSCTCIYPAPELREYAKRRSRRGKSRKRWSDWEAALVTIVNAALKAFFLAEVNSGCENNLNRRTLVYRLAGKRRFSVRARKNKAYVWQRGRFADDLSLWRKKLGPELEIEQVDDDRCLRFYMTTEEDFQQFKQCIVSELAQVEFISADSLEDIPQRD